MAVRTSTAADPAPSGRERATASGGASGPASAAVPAPGPIRTCIGCRGRSPAAELLRVVRVVAGTGPIGIDGCTDRVLAVPDPRRRAPGRGAWLHRETECVDLAERRRAFSRALRVSAAMDPTPVREYLLGLAPGDSTRPPSGTPQELKSNGSVMKRQQ